MDRRTLAIAALLLAVPLLAYPVVSPPPEPDPELSLYAETVPVDENELPDDVDIVEYEAFDDDERRFFDRAVDEPPHRETVDAAPERFVAFADGNDNVLVTREDDYFRTWATVREPTPPIASFLPHVLSIVAVAILMGVGGYAFVTAEG